MTTHRRHLARSPQRAIAAVATFALIGVALTSCAGSGSAPAAQQTSTIAFPDDATMIARLQTSVNKMSFPADYKPNAAKQWSEMAPNWRNELQAIPDQNALDSSAGMMSLCAWADEGLKRMAAKRPTDDVIEGMRVTKRFMSPGQSSDTAADSLISGITSKDPSELSAFRSANECD